jgi:hypothetical protein
MADLDVRAGKESAMAPGEIYQQTEAMKFEGKNFCRNLSNMNTVTG